MDIELTKMLDIQRMINSFEHKLKPICKQHLLTKTSILILVYIKSHNGCNARELGEYVGIKSNLVSMNIKHLMIKEYILRVKDEDDKRKSRLYCLPKANKLVEKIDSIKNKVVNEFFGELSIKEQEEFKKLIEVF